MFQKFEKQNYIKKVLRAGVFKILITIPTILENMQQLIIKPLGGPYDPDARKNDQKFKIQKLGKLQILLKTADIKILKNTPLHLEAMQ